MPLDGDFLFSIWHLLPLIYSIFIYLFTYLLHTGLQHCGRSQVEGLGDLRAQPGEDNGRVQTAASHHR